MTWIRVETNVAENDKVIALAEDLALPIEPVIGYLVRVWGRVADHRPNGDLKGMSDQAIEIWANWRGEPTLFAVAFRKRFMVGSVITGWMKRQGKLVERLQRDRGRKRPNLPHPRYIYVAYRGDGLLKIGCSRNPETRVRELSSLLGEDVVLVGMVPGNYETERKAHTTLAAYRVTGEWFEDSIAVRDWCQTVGLPLSGPLSGPLPDRFTERNGGITPPTPPDAHASPSRKPRGAVSAAKALREYEEAR